jgi:hypothetical protein
VDDELAFFFYFHLMVGEIEMSIEGKLNCRISDVFFFCIYAAINEPSICMGPRDGASSA